MNEIFTTLYNKRIYGSLRSPKCSVKLRTSETRQTLGDISEVYQDV